MLRIIRNNPEVYSLIYFEKKLYFYILILIITVLYHIIIIFNFSYGKLENKTKVQDDRKTTMTILHIIFTYYFKKVPFFSSFFVFNILLYKKRGKLAAWPTPELSQSIRAKLAFLI